MKYNININQKAIIDNALDLNINDALILDFLKDFCRPENIKISRIEFRGELYFWVSYSKLLEEMPLLTFKGEKQLSRKLKSLEKRGFLKRKIKKEIAKTKIYIALKPLIYLLSFTSNNSHPTKCPLTPDTSVLLHPTPVSDDHNTNNNNTNDNICNSAFSKPIAPQSISILKGNQPLTLEQAISYFKESPQRHIQLIGRYAAAKKPGLQTGEQWEEFLKRNLRAARSLAKFTDDQIRIAGEKIWGKKWLTDWTMETLLKFLINNH